MGSGGRHERARGAAEEHGLNRLREASRLGDHLAQRRARRHLVRPRLRHGPADRDQHGAGQRTPGKERDRGQRLHVLDQRRQAVDAALERQRRPHGGKGHPVVEVMDGGRLLPRHVASRGGHQVDHRMRSGSQPPFRQRRLQGPAGRVVLFADVERDSACADRPGRQQRTVEDQVRASGEQRPVLEAQGLTLGTVGQHHRRTAATVGDRAPLAADRESGSTAPPQPRVLEHRDQPRRGWQGTEALPVVRPSLRPQPGIRTRGQHRHCHRRPRLRRVQPGGPSGASGSGSGAPAFRRARRSRKKTATTPQQAV